MKIRTSVYVVSLILCLLSVLEISFMEHGALAAFRQEFSWIVLISVPVNIRYALHLYKSVKEDFPPDLEMFLLVLALNFVSIISGGLLVVLSDL